MIRRCATVLGLAAGLLTTTGCGTEERSGSVGDTLKAKKIEVTVQRIDTHVPIPARDVSGLSSPAPGYGLVAARVKVCSGQGAAIGQYDFALKLSGDVLARLKFPAQNYADDFEVVRHGCGEGWIVYEVPAGARASAITFGFDDTGHATNGIAGEEFHARFTWRLV